MMKKIAILSIALFILAGCEIPQPCYMQGVVTEQGTGARLSDVKISFDGGEYHTNSQGEYKIELTKTYESEPYSLEKTGYRNVSGTISKRSLDFDMFNNWEMTAE